ncbi:MAG: undecaprenyl diphosphate synthase family protein [Desulfurococcales archaeon]|nr:undecaprenyl diphosphate synthase family protein [Desulfurococcales archaeon]
MPRAPLHVGIIPDGNRRWARRHGVSLDEAYERGYETLRTIIDHLYSWGSRYVTVYVLSRDNALRRSKLELSLVFRLVRRGLKDLMSDEALERRDVRVEVLGDTSVLPADVADLARRLEEETSHRRGGLLVLLIGYSSLWELALALKGIEPPSTRLPPVDLVIRTGRWRRLSDFVPFAARYAELYFTETLWPDFTIEELERALDWFSSVKRNFGA